MNTYALTPFTWAVLGLCLILAALACFLFIRLTRFHRRQNQQLQDRKEHWSESARIVSLAVVQGQCEPSEGCLRLRYILNQLGDKHDILESMGEELAPFATHQERNDLDIQVRWKQDQKRLMIEEKYREEFIELCRKVAATYDFRKA